MGLWFRHCERTHTGARKRCRRMGTRRPPTILGSHRRRSATLRSRWHPKIYRWITRASSLSCSASPASCSGCWISNPFYFIFYRIFRSMLSHKTFASHLVFLLEFMYFGLFICFFFFFWWVAVQAVLLGCHNFLCAITCQHEKRWERSETGVHGHDVSSASLCPCMRLCAYIYMYTILISGLWAWGLFIHTNIICEPECDFD